MLSLHPQPGKLRLATSNPTPRPWESSMTHMLGQRARRGRDFERERVGRGLSRPQVARILRCQVNEVIGYERGESGEHYENAIQKLACLHLKWINENHRSSNG